MNYTPSGAGTPEVNVTFAESGTNNGRPVYAFSTRRILWDGSMWRIMDIFDLLYWYFNTADEATPPLTGWSVDVDGANPAPTLASDSNPIITSFTPTSGTVGTEVVITGSGFTGASDVEFYYAGLVGPGPAYNSWTFTVDSDTQITAVATALPVGENAAYYAGEIKVTTAGGSDQSTPPPYFTFTPAATVNSRGFFAVL